MRAGGGIGRQAEHSINTWLSFLSGERALLKKRRAGPSSECTDPAMDPFFVAFLFVF